MYMKITCAYTSPDKGGGKGEERATGARVLACERPASDSTDRSDRSDMAPALTFLAGLIVLLMVRAPAMAFQVSAVCVCVHNLVSCWRK